MISKEVMEVKYACEIKMDKLFIDAIKRIKEILEDEKSELSTLKSSYDKARKEYQACVADIILKDNYSIRKK